jgi:predicted RNase H-like HicB family nuclease
MPTSHVMPFREGHVKTYIFKAVVEPDEERWSAWCPALVAQGASSWGDTREEALRNLEEVVHMVVESLRDQVQISSEPQVAITL